MASLKEHKWCELCSLLSTITSLHSREHAGQSEINALSLGNTQELVSFIVLFSADNCFAAVPQNDKTMSLWQMARAHVQEYLTTGCNIVSHLIFFLVLPLKILTFNETWKNRIFSPSSDWQWFWRIDFDVVLLSCLLKSPSICGEGKQNENKKSRRLTSPSSSAYSNTEMWQTTRLTHLEH